MKQQKLPFNTDIDYEENQNQNENENVSLSYFTENILNQRDMIQRPRPKLSKRAQLKLNRKTAIKLKQRGINIENMNQNELIQRNNFNQNDQTSSLSHFHHIQTTNKSLTRQNNENKIFH